MNENFTVISFFTSEYTQDALRLIDSLELFDIKHDVHGVQSKGSWVANVSYKAAYCKQKFIEHNMAVAWVDCDAEIKKYPFLFDFLSQDNSFDIAVYHRQRRQRPNELLSGTVFFNNTIKAWTVLNNWEILCIKNPNRWDQWNLDDAIKACGDWLKVFEFPSSYVRIFDADDMQDVEPVILHHQASRRLKRIVT